LIVVLLIVPLDPKVIVEAYGLVPTETSNPAGAATVIPAVIAEPEAENV
jgi:hypothetical protein